MIHEIFIRAITEYLEIPHLVREFKIVVGTKYGFDGVVLKLLEKRR